MQELTRKIHALNKRLERAAEHLLPQEAGLAYRRYVTIFAAIELGPTSQRELAVALGVTEASVSRMVRSLAADGWLLIDDDPAGGRRRRVTVTAEGRTIVRRCGAMLEKRFAEIVEASGVSYEHYSDQTSRLLDALTDPSTRQGPSS